jgi:hypothetical protein
MVGVLTANRTPRTSHANKFMIICQIETKKYSLKSLRDIEFGGEDRVFKLAFNWRLGSLESLRAMWHSTYRMARKVYGPI